jgi:hypothetical protein
LLGLLGAMIGFSFALATSQNDAGGRDTAGNSAGPRTVGTGLKFSNPPLLPGQDSNFPNGGLTSSDPNGFDLGDAYYGSQLVRYLTGLGGVVPYKFTSTDVPANLKLLLKGELTGSIPATSGTFVKFNATLTDAANVTRTGVFRINVFPPSTFRFAHDRLSLARVGQDYITKLEVLNGDVNTKFSVVAGSTFQSISTVTTGVVTTSNVPVANLEAIGLSVFEDGTLAGRPLRSGTFTFVARATTTGGATALNRQGTAPDQFYTITIEDLQNVESVLATFSSTITANASRPGRDIFSYNAFFNSNGLTTFDFRSAPVTVRVAGKTFTTTLDSRGRATTGDLRVQLSAPTGLLRISVRNQNFTPQLGALVDLSKKIIVVQIQIGETFLGTEPLYYNVRARNGHVRLNYGLGRSRQIGGLFQILAIKGKDFSSGTAFKVKFLISQVPDTQGESFGEATDATVSIGPAFNETIPFFRGRGRYPPPGIADAAIDGVKKVGVFDTYSLPESLTGIKRAADGNGAKQTFLLGMKVNTNRLTFNGAASRIIFPIRFPFFF